MLVSVATFLVGSLMSRTSHSQVQQKAVLSRQAHKCATSYFINYCKVCQFIL
jgi:hypothetical protein